MADIVVRRELEQFLLETLDLNPQKSVFSLFLPLQIFVVQGELLNLEALVFDFLHERLLEGVALLAYEVSQSLHLCVCHIGIFGVEATKIFSKLSQSAQSMAPEQICLPAVPVLVTLRVPLSHPLCEVSQVVLVVAGAIYRGEFAQIVTLLTDVDQ